ncbi:MAG: AAA family ATPase, partial [Polyangiaceae bacterium]|nr:AAA family ATPase [Polyangiaceae bacterium]
MRDLHGRVRLVVDPDPVKAPVDLKALTAALKQELGEYFAGPIWSTDAGGKDATRLAGAVLRRPAALPWSATYDDPATGARGQAARATWRKLERRLSKQAWLEAARPGVPWELGQGPGVVTFYSFKGGVGRTTALVACAWQLARAGQSVAVIDLDLEAPGVAALVDGEVKGEGARGVIDFLADHLATDSTS